MKIDQLWFPYRWGLRLRKTLVKFSASYGSKYFSIQRPLAVFISALLDDKHQELFDKTPHSLYKNHV